ncbi:hypothetical protein SELMODRAFT_87987, partial [Selaginella moellendorffii]
DVRVQNGGEIRELSSYKLPILRTLGLVNTSFFQGAMVAPNWFHGSHQILYVVHGRGRIEVVDPSGERVLDAELEQGSLVVVPAFYPSSEESFHYITFVTSHRPMISYLSRRNSVYRGIPLRVLSRMLNIREEKANVVQSAHQEEAIIFAREAWIEPFLCR